MCSVNYVVCVVCAVCSVPCTVCSVQFAVLSVKCEVCSVQCAVYTGAPSPFQLCYALSLTSPYQQQQGQNKSTDSSKIGLILDNKDPVKRGLFYKQHCYLLVIKSSGNELILR